MGKHTSNNTVYHSGRMVVLLAALGLVSCSYYTRKRPQKCYRQVQEQGMVYDAAIVPGYPFDGRSWDSLMKARVLWVCHLYRQGIVRNVIFSGAAVHSPYVEAHVMGRYARALGIPEAHIFYETRAEHSTENIYYSYLLARKEGFHSLVLCTDPVQSLLLQRFMRRRFGTPIGNLPFIQAQVQADHALNPLIDTSGLRIPEFVPLKERVSRWQSFRGTMGRDINWGPDGRLAPL